MQDNTKAKPKLAIGQAWKMRNGGTVKIVDFFEGEIYPWLDSDHKTYTEDGSYLDTGISVYDLVELVRDAPTQATKPVIKHIYFYSATVYKNGNQTNVSGLYTSYGVKIQSEEDYSEFMQNIAHSLMADRQDLHVTTLSYHGESE